jgi:predicted glycogen debranching enzyme
MSSPSAETREWLEADGLGGFASGTVAGIRTRRYHALLLTATTPPTGRVVLVNGFDAWVHTADGSCALSTQRYAPDVLHPDGASRIVSFTSEPWPTWEFATPDGARLLQEILVEHDSGAVLITWSLIAAAGPVTLRARPLLSGRDYHSLHHENGGLRFDADRKGAAVVFHPYDTLPCVVSSSNGDYRHAPDWYRNFLYAAELERGLDAVEDLASPGEFSWSLSAPGDQAIWCLRAAPDAPTEALSRESVVELHQATRAAETRRRSAFPPSRHPKSSPTPRSRTRCSIKPLRS